MMSAHKLPLLLALLALLKLSQHAGPPILQQLKPFALSDGFGWQGTA